MSKVQIYLKNEKATNKIHRTNQDVLDELGLSLDEFKLVASVFRGIDLSNLLFLLSFGYFLAEQKNQTTNGSPKAT